jgi:hypothetical protein
VKKALACALLLGGAFPAFGSTLVGNPEIVARVVPPPGWTVQSATVHLAAVDLEDCSSGGTTVTVPSSLDWLASPVYFPTGSWCGVTMDDVEVDVVASVNGQNVQWTWTGDLTAVDPDELDIVTGTTQPVVVKIAVGVSAPTAWFARP